MVVLGGVTRLTRSGLSMTDWKFQWESPPLSDADWAREFDKYRRSPEFKLANASMTVEEYKFIFWMEYGHRMWGRGLGVFFALPLCGFLYNGWITKKLGARLLSFFALGAGQGLIGWWMVKSGLELDTENPLNVPRVSPYRLATHLTGAFTIYTAMLWTTFSVLFPNGATGPSVDAAARVRRRHVAAAQGVPARGLDRAHRSVRRVRRRSGRRPRVQHVPADGRQTRARRVLGRLVHERVAQLFRKRRRRAV
jgi:cytochrome c oxidase assembly protein subunit 15